MNWYVSIVVSSVLLLSATVLLSEDFQVDGSLNISSDLVVDGSARVGGDLSVTGEVSAVRFVSLYNVASGENAAAVGGGGNVADGSSAFVGGGVLNQAGGALSFVGGGLQNSATGPYSTVLGGLRSSADGAFSFAAGYGAEAIHANTFVWAGAPTLETTAPGQFLVNAPNGVGINTNETSGHALVVSGDTLLYGDVIADRVWIAAPGGLEEVIGYGYLTNYVAHNPAYGVLLSDGSIPISGDQSVEGTLQADTFVGSDNYSLVEGAAAVGGQGNVVRSKGSFVGGGWQNLAGKAEETMSMYSNDSVLGGHSNTATGGVSAVISGLLNRAGGFGASVLGGVNNIVDGAWGSVAGGLFNVVYADFGLVGSGQQNIVERGATVGVILAGLNNTIEGGGLYSLIGSGWQNTASGNTSAILSGRNNNAVGDYSLVGNGVDNIASGNYAAVLSGYQNEAGSLCASVLGGMYNIASGTNSLAAGVRAVASNDYAFVWSDGVETGSTSTNQFMVHARGGIRLLGAPTQVADAKGPLDAVNRQTLDQRVNALMLARLQDVGPFGDVSMGSYTNRP